MLVFSDHQSIINGNIPLRDLMYVGRTYEQLVPVKHRYKEKTVKILRPELFFYNRTKYTESEYKLKLLDAYFDKNSVDSKEEKIG